MTQGVPIWQLDRISKRFPGSLALDGVSLDIYSGEVHALCGENGAGKTTLMQILAGNVQAGSGRLLHQGKPIVLKDPLQARTAGICLVQQDRSLFMDLSVAENIFAGFQPVNALGLIDQTLLHTLTRQLLRKLHLHELEPGMQVALLSTAQQQMVELAKALAQHPTLLVLDEPTASVTLKETEILFRIVRDLQRQGVAVIYISHRLEEVFKIADRVTVLKDGRLVATLPASSATRDDIIRLMVGRDIPAVPVGLPSFGATALELRHFSGKGFHDINLEIRCGEIVGLAGLMGSGRTEIAEALFCAGMGGRSGVRSGELHIDGRRLRLRNTGEAIRAGISYLPQERKTLGGFMEMSLAENILSADTGALGRHSWFNRRRMHSIARKFIAMLKIVATSTEQTMQELSGGNQQKAIFAKWLLQDNPILLINEPTHGVDIGAKFEIYRMLRQLAAEGKAILLISSEMTELLLLSDMIHVLYKGRIKASYLRQEATEEKIIERASGL